MYYLTSFDHIRLKKQTGSLNPAGLCNSCSADLRSVWMNFCCRMFQAGFCITCTVKDMNHSLLLVFFPHLCCQPKTFGGQTDAVLTVFWYFLVFLLVTNECAHHTHVLFVILFLLLNKIENSSVKMLSWRLNSSVAFNIIGQKIEFLGKI